VSLPATAIWGRGHFSSVTPSTKLAVRLLLAICTAFLAISAQASQQKNYPFSVETEKEGDGHRIVARNNGPAPVSVKVELLGAYYTKPDRPFPVYVVVPPGGGTLYLGRMRPAMSGVGYTFRTQWSWVFGDFNAVQSPDAVYRLPFKEGATYRIGQAAGGPISTHTSPDSQYAVDIPMPEGTPIVAARDGVVIASEAGQLYGAQVPDLLDKANEVRIQHLDGTMAVYAHLQYGGVFVYPGQRVVAGQQIGLAGSTGYSSGPHLHFAVQTVRRNGDQLETVSLPFRFYVGVPPAAFAPQFGMIAKADYSSPAAVPGFEPPVRVVRVSPERPVVVPDTPAAGNADVTVSFQVPPEVRRFLLKIPAWQWFVGMVGLILLLVMLDKARVARRERAWREICEPGLMPPAAGPRSSSSLTAYDKLLIACGGDRSRAARLQAYEYQRAPDIDDEVAALRAWQRLQRDRH
jgi:murein DD-endopeptidase MepM/ murein hydrolase activator NlpD